MPCITITIKKTSPFGENKWYSSAPGRGDPQFKPRTSSCVIGSYVGLARLRDDFILAAGGASVSAQNPLNNCAEIYNFISNTWALTSNSNFNGLAGWAAQVEENVVAMLGSGSSHPSVTTHKVYNHNTLTWTDKPGLGVSSLRETSVTKLQDKKIMVAGGRIFASSPSSLVYVYDYNTDTWALQASLPTARAGLSGARLSDGLVAIVGGYYGNYISVSTNEVFNYSTNTWLIKTPMITARHYLVAVRLREFIMTTVGGMSINRFSSANEIYDFLTNTWAVGAQVPTERIMLSGARLRDGIISTFGGTNGARTHEIYVY